MKRQGKKLQFISLIKRDGSGTVPVGTEWNNQSDYAKTDDISYLDTEIFNVYRLSISEETFIAIGFNSWVVRLKNDKKMKDFKSILANNAFRGKAPERPIKKNGLKRI